MLDHRICRLLACSVALVLLAPSLALAYIGPGTGLEFVPYFIALLWGAGVALGGVLLWPFLALLRRIRGVKQEDASEEAGAETETGTDEAGAEAAAMETAGATNEAPATTTIGEQSGAGSPPSA